MEENKKINPEGFEALLKQNEIAEQEKKVLGKNESIESRIIKNAPKRGSGTVRSFRTLQGDVEEGVNHGKTTIVSMMASESRAQSVKNMADDIFLTVKSERTKKIAAYILGLVLLGSGGSALYYVLSKEDAVVKIADQESFIFAEETYSIDITGRSSAENRALFEKERQKLSASLGSMVEIRLTRTISLPENKTEVKILTTEEFFQSFKLKPPPRLLRSFQPNFMLGFNVLSKNEPFLLLKTTSYEIAFSDMLDWEKDVSGFFRPKRDFVKIGTTTAPSSDSLIFKDAIYKNIDTRELKNEAGKTLLIYAFPNQETLVISTNPVTIGEVIDRLTTRKVVR